jgi:hypothetical protein
MSCLNNARDAVDLIAAAVNAAFGVVEHSAIVEYLIDRCASTHGIDLTEHVMEIAKQQGRCSLGHGFSPFGVEFGLRCRGGYEAQMASDTVNVRCMVDDVEAAIAAKAPRH